MTIAVKPNERVRILWVDDDIGTLPLKVTQHVLEREFDLLTATSREAMSRILQGTEPGPEAILLDVVFTTRSGVDFPASQGSRREGLALLQAIREGAYGERWTSVPIVALTAFTVPGDIAEMNDRLAKDPRLRLLRKPIAPREIVRVLRESVGRTIGG